MPYLFFSIYLIFENDLSNYKIKRLLFEDEIRWPVSSSDGFGSLYSVISSIIYLKVIHIINLKNYLTDT